MAAATKSQRKRSNSKSTKPVKNNKFKNEIILLALVAVIIILILSNFDLAGIVGEYIKYFMFGILGVMEYVFPFVLLGTVIYMASNKDKIGVARIKSALTLILMILIAAFWQRVDNVPDIESTSLGGYYTYCGSTEYGGGFLGGAICKLLSPLGLWGSLVIIILLVIITLVFITEKSFIKGLLHLKDNGSKVVKKAKEDYSEYRQHGNNDNYKKTEENNLSERGERIDRSRLNELKQRDRQMKKQAKYERKKQELQQKEQELEKKIQEQNKEPRTERKARGVTDDLFIPRDSSPVDNFDIHEIGQEEVKHSEDVFKDNIYDPESVKTTKTDSEPKPVEEVKAARKVEQKVEEADEVKSVADASESKHMGNTYVFPPISLLKKGAGSGSKSMDMEHKETALRLQQTLQNFGVKVTITDISCGPSVTRYELQPEQGVKVSKIVSLSDDIKLNLAAADIRIEAPIPGKAAVGIEVPNKTAGSVSLRDLIESQEFIKSTSEVSFAAGKDIAGQIIIADIAKMPHLLIAGATGSGKSVCINTIIMSILYKANPDDVKLIMIDPKVVELSTYNGIPHLLLPVVTDPKKAAGALNWAVEEMTKRYKKFADMNVRDLKGYNAKVSKMKFDENEPVMEKMPQIVVIIDELADLMMVAPGEVEDAICRLAQLARAAGIHLVIATQRPSVNVITGLIKANVPSRIAFSVSSGVDSRTIIDMNGAEKLLGKGDMLFFPSGYPKPVRVQGAFVSDEEVGGVVEFIKSHLPQEVQYNTEITDITTSSAASMDRQDDERDSYFAEAGRFVIEKEKGSIGMLQRYYKIGFNRAGRIMDQLADAGVVGPELGTKPRKILMTNEEFEEFLQENNIN